MCPATPVTFYLDSNGIAVVNPSLTNAQFILGGPECNPRTTSTTPSQVSCDQVGTTQITLGATNILGTSFTQCPFNVVQPNFPTAICKQSIDIFLSPVNNVVNISVADVNAGSFGVCGLVSLQLSNTQFSCSNVGARNVVVLTITDKAGHVSTCSTVVRVFPSYPNQCGFCDPCSTLRIAPIQNGVNITNFGTRADSLTLVQAQLTTGTFTSVNGPSCTFAGAMFQCVIQTLAPQQPVIIGFTSTSGAYPWIQVGQCPAAPLAG